MVKPDRGQLSNESGATDELGVLTPEVTGVISVTGRNTGPLGLYFDSTCWPLGVRRRGEDAAEPISVNGPYGGALKETMEPPEEPVRVRARLGDERDPPEELVKVRGKPGDERIELAEPDRTVSGDGSRRQESEDESDEVDFIDSAEVRPEGGFLLLDGICIRE